MVGYRPAGGGVGTPSCGVGESAAGKAPEVGAIGADRGKGPLLANAGSTYKLGQTNREPHGNRTNGTGLVQRPLENRAGGPAVRT